MSDGPEDDFWFELGVLLVVSVAVLSLVAYWACKKYEALTGG